jgi:hypothetical protein
MEGNESFLASRVDLPKLQEAHGLVNRTKLREYHAEMSDKLYEIDREAAIAKKNFAERRKLARHVFAEKMANGIGVDM